MARNPHGSKTRHAKLKALGIFAGLSTLIGAAAMVTQLGQAPTLDPQHCPADRPLATSTVVLVDTTDPLTDADVADLTRVVQETEQASPEYGKLGVLVMDGAHPYRPAERVSLCSPLPPRLANPLTHTVARV